MLTPFGKCLRKMRIDKGLLLKDTSNVLGVTSSFLSSVEHGKKEIPANWEEKISMAYSLNDSERSELRQAIMDSKSYIKLNIANESRLNRDVALCFSRKLNELDNEAAAKILDILNGRRD